MELPDKILSVVESFSKLPGVGQKTATRQVLQMTKWEIDSLVKFSESVKELCELRKCDDCGFFSEHQLCGICTDESRSSSGTLCIVEEVTDCMAIEKSGSYKGLYHVLGGVLNPMLGVA